MWCFLVLASLFGLWPCDLPWPPENMIFHRTIFKRIKLPGARRRSCHIAPTSNKRPSVRAFSVHVIQCVMPTASRDDVLDSSSPTVALAPAERSQHEQRAAERSRHRLETEKESRVCVTIE
jgi:hypothetical protein